MCSHKSSPRPISLRRPRRKNLSGERHRHRRGRVSDPPLRAGFKPAPDPFGLYWAAYKNSAGTDFFPPSGAGVRPLNYINGPYLTYAGNPGYNYQVPEGTQVLATADGKLFQAVTDPVNGAGYDDYHNSYIDHQNGWYSWYLYTPLDSAILAQISLNGFAQVTKGQPIGKSPW